MSEIVKDESLPAMVTQGVRAQAGAMVQSATRCLWHSLPWRQPEPWSGSRSRPGSADRARRLATVIALVASALLIPAVPASADDSQRRVDVAAVDEFISTRLTSASIPGAAIAITRGDQVLHVRGYGHDSHRAPVTESTLFRIASLSKSFTSLAVLQLVDAGELSLDDPVGNHLPQFRPADPRGIGITVRQLLDQTSGLADREVPELSRRQPATLAEAATSLNSAPLVAAPGTQFNYHNPNYHVAARLVEVVSGESYENYLRAHVFHPAGMPASLTTLTDDQPLPGLAEGHVLAYGRPIPAPALGTFSAGAGDVVSTAADMAQWLIVHANGGQTADGARLVSERSLHTMHTASAPSGYALGWDTDGPAAAPTRMVHSGNHLTFSAYQAIIPDTGYGVALLFNSGSALLRDQTSIFYGVLDLVEGNQSAPGSSRPSTETLDALLGCLTLAVLVLGSRSVYTSRRWATRHAPSSRARTALRLIPHLVVVGLVAGFMDLAEFLMGGRDVTWLAAAYGWPALVVFVLVVFLATAATLFARGWQLSLVSGKGPRRRAAAPESGTLPAPRPTGGPERRVACNPRPGC